MAANEESAESIRTKKLTRKTVFFGGGWKARGLPKGGFGCGLAIKAKKGGKKVQAGRISLRPMLAAYRNFFSLFFDFDVCRFCTSKRCFGYFCL